MTLLSLSKTMIGKASELAGTNPGSPVVANPAHRRIISADRFSTAASFAPAMMGAFIQARQVPSANGIEASSPHHAKAERTQPIVDTDHDNAVSCRQISAVIPRQRARTADKAPP
jgi:hypothetical protein